MFESSTINPIWSDCLVHFIRESNNINDLFLTDNQNNKSKMELDNLVGLTFPNG